MLTFARRASYRFVVLLSILFAVVGAHKTTLQATGLMNLGASCDSTQSNIGFRVYSSRATRLEVWIYTQPSGAQEKAHFVMAKDATNNIWSKTVSASALQTRYGVHGPVYYGYRAWGPNWLYKKSWTKGSTAGFIADVDGNGNRFNPNKLLIDPYAMEISQDPKTPTQADGAIYGSGPNYRAVDTGAQAPKGIVLKPDSVSTGTHPTRPFKDEIIYEVHVRGLTMNDTAIAPPERGTYKAAGQKAAYLKSLGVTAIEFLPVQ
jgi:glycogen operon protein